MSLIIESLDKVATIGDAEFGCSIGSPVLTDSGLADLVKLHCGSVTIDNAMKIGIIRPNPTTVDYGPADALVGWADKNKLRVRGHNLVWNASVPTWIAQLPADQRRDLMFKHIDETIAHFSTVEEWDVVNEPIEPANKLPGNLRGGPWYDAFGGEAYIIEAFKRAGANFGRLVLNEQGLEQPGFTSPLARQSFVALIDRMLDAGLRFEVGIEGHIESQAGVSVEGMQWLVRQLEDRELFFRITELDDWDYWFFNNAALSVDQHDRKVSDQVRDLLFPVICSPYCRGVTTWELVDSYSAWRKNSPASRPLPFDDSMQPKMMALAIRDAFMLRNASVSIVHASESSRLADALP